MVTLIMTIHARKSLLSALVIAAMAVAAAPTDSGEGQPDQGAGEAVQQPAKKSASQRRSRGSELDRCKREARGLKGPERGTFMTECLAADRYEK